MKTRCKDKNGAVICVGDILHVEEYPDRWVGGSLDFEGVVTLDKGRAMVTYYDIGEEGSYPVSAFPIAGRLIWPEEWRHDYWETAFLGNEPPEELWREDLYREHFEKIEVEERNVKNTGSDSD